MSQPAWPWAVGAALGMGLAGALWSWSPSAKVAAALLVLCTVAILARRPLRNLVNGVWLRREGVGPGHYIRLEGPQDVEGYVETVGPTRTTLQTPLGARQKVPNQVLANAVFTSFNVGDERHALVDIEAHESVPSRDVIPVLQAVAQASPGVESSSTQIQQLPGRFPGSRRYMVRTRLRAAAVRKETEVALQVEAARRLREAGIPVPDYVPPKDKT